MYDHSGIRSRSCKASHGDYLSGNRVKMRKKNCWEHMKCGRHPGGQASGAGVCSVSVHEELNGMHGGKNAGRACWVIDDSLCPDEMRKSSTMKFAGCWKCDFYHLVRDEERSSPHGFMITYREMKKSLNNKK